MDYLINNTVIKAFTDQFSNLNQRRAIKAALIYGIQSLRRDFKTTNIKLSELQQILIQNEEDFLDRRMNQIASQEINAQKDKRHIPVREQTRWSPKRESNARNSTVYSDSYSPNQRNGNMLLTKQEAEESMNQRHQLGTFTHRNDDEKEVKFSIDQNNYTNYLRMTKPSSSWRKGDPQIFYRNVPINPWKRERKRLSNSVQGEVYPKWWGSFQEQEQPVKLVGQSGGTSSAKKERLRHKSFQQENPLPPKRKKPAQLKKQKNQASGSAQNRQKNYKPLYVRTCDQHKNKTKLTNPFKSTYHHRGQNQPTSKKKLTQNRDLSHDEIKMRKMPINFKAVESKIKGQVMKDKERDRVQRIIDQQIGKQSARVEIKYPPYKIAPLRQTSRNQYNKKEERNFDQSNYSREEQQEDGYEPGQSKNQFNEQSEFIQPHERKKENHQQNQHPDIIANNMLNSPFIQKFQDPSPQYPSSDGIQRQHKKQASSGAVAPQKLNPSVIDSHQFQKPPYYHYHQVPNQHSNRPYRYKQESSKEPSTIQQRARQTGMSDLYNRPDISSVYTKSPQNAFDRYIPSSGGITQYNFNPNGGYQAYPQQMIPMSNNNHDSYYMNRYPQPQSEESKYLNPKPRKYAKDTSNSGFLSSDDKSINKTPGVISSIQGLPSHPNNNETNLSNANSQTSPGSNYLSGELFDETNNDAPHISEESPQIPKNSGLHKRNKVKKDKRRSKQNQIQQERKRKKQCDTWVGQYVMRDSFPRNPQQLASSSKYTYNVMKNSAEMRRLSRQQDYSIPNDTNNTGSSPPLSNYNQRFVPGYSQASFSQQPYVARSNPNGITNYSGFSSDLGVRENRVPPPVAVYRQQQLQQQQQQQQQQKYQPLNQAPFRQQQQYDPYSRSSYNYNKGRYIGEPLRRSKDRADQYHENFSAA